MCSSYFSFWILRCVWFYKSIVSQYLKWSFQNYFLSLSCIWGYPRCDSFDRCLRCNICPVMFSGGFHFCGAHFLYCFFGAGLVSTAVSLKHSRPSVLYIFEAANLLLLETSIPWQLNRMTFYFLHDLQDLITIQRIFGSNIEVYLFSLRLLWMLSEKSPGVFKYILYYNNIINKP